MTWAGWSQKLNSLAVATSRGSLLLINPAAPGAAHPREHAEASITTAAWNTQTLVALASADNKVALHASAHALCSPNGQLLQSPAWCSVESQIHKLEGPEPVSRLHGCMAQPCSSSQAGPGICWQQDSLFAMPLALGSHRFKHLLAWHHSTQGCKHIQRL